MLTVRFSGVGHAVFFYFSEESPSENFSVWNGDHTLLNSNHQAMLTGRFSGVGHAVFLLIRVMSHCRNYSDSDNFIVNSVNESVFFIDLP